MRYIAALLVLLLAASVSGPAHAQIYGELSYATVSKTMLRFNAYNLARAEVLEDYLKINECEAYKKVYYDDFAMKTLRDTVQKTAISNATSFPDAYYFKAPMKLDRYDFTARMFRLSEKSKLYNINSFALVNMHDSDVCVIGEKLQALPKSIGAVLDQPVTLEGLPISEERAQKLITDMNASGNRERQIYARFNLMVTFAPPITDLPAGSVRYNMDAQLLTIEFFEDPEFTKPIWIFNRS